MGTFTVKMKHLHGGAYRFIVSNEADAEVARFKSEHYGMFDWDTPGPFTTKQQRLVLEPLATALIGVYVVAAGDRHTAHAAIEM